MMASYISLCVWILALCALLISVQVLPVVGIALDTQVSLIIDFNYCSLEKLRVCFGFVFAFNCYCLPLNKETYFQNVILHNMKSWKLEVHEHSRGLFPSDMA